MNPTYRRLLGYLRPYRTAFILSAICMTCAAAAEVGFAKFIGLLIDEGFTGRADYIWKGPAIIFGLIGARAFLQFCSSYLLSYIAHRMQLDLRAAMFTQLVRLPVTFFDRHASANIITKLTADVNNIGGAAGHVLTIMIRDSLSATAMLGYLLYLNWRLTLITLVILPVVIVSTRKLGRRLRDMSQKSQLATGDMLRVLQETTDGQKVIKIYGGQAYETQRFDAISHALRGYAMRIATAQAIGSPLTQLASGAAVAAVICVAIYKH